MIINGKTGFDYVILANGKMISATCGHETTALNAYCAEKKCSAKMAKQRYLDSGEKDATLWFCNEINAIAVWKTMYKGTLNDIQRELLLYYKEEGSYEGEVD